MEHFKIGMKNTYTIYKVVDGKRQELAHFHNIVLDQLKQRMTSTYLRIHSVWFGDGTAEPAASDTALTHALWTFSWNYNKVEEVRAPYISEDGTWNIECTTKVDATSAYVGTVSEVGIAFAMGTSSLILGTKALIKDAEGNPMTITKTDSEVLYVDIHIQYQLSTSRGFEWNPNYMYLLQGTSNWVPIPGIYRPRIAMLRSVPDLMSSGSLIGSRVFLSTSYDSSEHILTCSNGRFGTDNQTTQDYVNAIAVTTCFNGDSSYDSYLPTVPIGIWRFPNAEIFPDITLEDMRVGTGDGETTEFTPPLNLWVKDTEKIYVDGVLQERGVDYTCDHRNNLDNLYALNPSIFCNIHNHVIRTETSNKSNMGYHPLKGGANKVNTSSSTETRTYLEWDKDHPLEWELEEDPQIGMEADYFQMQGILNTAGNYNYWRYAVFTLCYSEDGSTWTEAGTITISDNTTSASGKIEFAETIKAKYWRLSVDVSQCTSESLQNGRFYTTSISYLHRNGSPIVFTNPPAANAIITMTADIDRPMKNSNFILDVNPTFQL